VNFPTNKVGLFCNLIVLLQFLPKLFCLRCATRWWWPSDRWPDRDEWSFLHFLPFLLVGKSWVFPVI